MIFLGVIVLLFAAIAGISDLSLRLQDRSLNARFRENQRIHHRKETP